MIYWLALLLVNIILFGGTFLLIGISKGWSKLAIKISVSLLLIIVLASIYFISLILPT